MITRVYELFLANTRAPRLLLSNKCQNQHLDLSAVSSVVGGWRKVAEVGGDVGARSQGFSCFFGGAVVNLLRNVSGSHSYAVVLSIMGADVQSHGATDGPSPCRLRFPGTFFMDELLAGGARNSRN